MSTGQLGFVDVARLRRDSVIQVVRERPDDIPRHRWESIAVFVFFLLGYFLLGAWLVLGVHIVGFASLDRLGRAVMIWHNDPPKLSAVGFDYPPLTTILLAPLTVFSGWASSLAVVPLISAPFAAWAMMALNTMMRRVSIGGPLRLLILVALGCNPLVALYASDGAADFMGLCFAMISLGCLLAWYVTADIRFVILAGIGFAVAALAGYSSLLWFVVAAIGVVVTLASNGARNDEMEGTLVGFALPTVAILALWTLVSFLLVQRPFAWIISAGAGAGTFSFGDIVADTGGLLLGGAPLAIVVLPLLVIVGARQRSGFAMWIAGLLAVAIVQPGIAAWAGLSTSPLTMRNALPILFFAVVGGIWLARLASTRRAAGALLLAAALVASIPWTFAQMQVFPRQDLESVFASAIATGHDQEGARTTNGRVVGIGSEQQMANWIKTHVAANNTILADNAKTYAVILMTGKPALFVDRVDKSDGPWLSIADAPAGKVLYLLLSRLNADDVLTQRYAAAAAGTDPLLPVAFQTDRYTLVAVPAGYVRPATTGGGS